MQIAIYGQLTRNTRKEKVLSLINFLEEHNVFAGIYKEYADALELPRVKTFEKISELENCDYLFSIGGDGTLLNAMHRTAPMELPVVGINVGRLGFLAGFSQEEMLKVADSLLKEQIHIEERSMLEVRSNFEPLASLPPALNELTIHKSNSNEMIVIETFVNGEYLNTYWADGLIISTPTGSTAYSLACGGPILTPQTHAFILTPIAPHSLTVRPIVIPDDVIISFEVKSRSGQAMLAADNITKIIPNEIELAAVRARKNARLVKTAYVPTFLETIRKRLHWGEDVRNKL